MGEAITLYEELSAKQQGIVMKEMERLYAPIIDSEKKQVKFIITRFPRRQAQAPKPRVATRTRPTRHSVSSSQPISPAAGKPGRSRGKGSQPTTDFTTWEKEMRHFAIDAANEVENFEVTVGSTPNSSTKMPKVSQPRPTSAGSKKNIRLPGSKKREMGRKWERLKLNTAETIRKAKAAEAIRKAKADRWNKLRLKASGTSKSKSSTPSRTKSVKSKSSDQQSRESGLNEELGLVTRVSLKEPERFCVNLKFGKNFRTDDGTFINEANGNVIGYSKKEGVHYIEVTWGDTIRCKPNAYSARSQNVQVRRQMFPKETFVDFFVAAGKCRTRLGGKKEANKNEVKMQQLLKKLK